MSIRLSNGKKIPIEMHKICIVQKTRLAPARERLRVIEEAGYNTFLLRTRGIFLDMLTDSGTIAMTNVQQGAMMVGGLKFIEEPPVLRFFAGRMKSLGGWREKLTAAFEKDFGTGC